jgi:hypothetical protein
MIKREVELIYRMKELMHGYRVVFGKESHVLVSLVCSYLMIWLKVIQAENSSILSCRRGYMTG